MRTRRSYSCRSGSGQPPAGREGSLERRRKGQDAPRGCRGRACSSRCWRRSRRWALRGRGRRAAGSGRGDGERMKELIRTGKHRDDRQQDLLDALDRAPALTRRLVVVRVVAGRVQDRDADLAVGVPAKGVGWATRSAPRTRSGKCYRARHVHCTTEDRQEGGEGVSPRQRAARAAHPSSTRRGRTVRVQQRRVKLHLERAHRVVLRLWGGARGAACRKVSMAGAWRGRDGRQRTDARTTAGRGRRRPRTACPRAPG